MEVLVAAAAGRKVGEIRAAGEVENLRAIELMVTNDLLMMKATELIEM